MTSTIQTFCLLCGSDPSSHPVLDNDQIFCCQGCLAVYNVLKIRNQLDNYEENPVFLEAIRFGLISNSTLLESIRQSRAQLPDGEYEKLHLEIGDLWCPSCAEVIRLMLLCEKGVRNCVVDYATDLASVEFTPRIISKDKILEFIRSLGYQPQLFQSIERKRVTKGLYLRFIIAAFFSLNIMMFAYPIYAGYFDSDLEGYDFLFAWISLISSLPVVTYSFWPILKRGWGSLKIGLLGMEALVIVGAGTAFGVSVYEMINGRANVYFDSLTVIITFVLLGKIIEARSKFSAKEAMLRLYQSVPKRGRKLFSDGSSKFVPIKEISVGDILVALTGDKIVLDGVIIEGEGACDESLMTGESLPVAKGIGKGILGGTILLQGKISYRVTANLEQTALQRIIGMVEKDIGVKNVSVRAADEVVRWFVPVVCCIALGVVGWGLIVGLSTHEIIMRAISVFLISCPCAIGIAAPLAESQLMSELAQLGVIVRNRRALAFLGRETLFVFDKTGTVTEGYFHVLDGLEGLDTHQLSYLKALSSQSNHPTALAISREIPFDGFKLESTLEVVGKGMIGEHKGNRYLLGSDLFLRNHGIDVSSSGISTTVYFAENKTLLTLITLGDSIRSGVKEVVRALSPVKTVLLSGDGEKPVEAVAKECGFGSWLWNYSPLQKQEYIHQQKRRGEIVCMMGDGINDAPALTAAHAGISVVSATDVSIQVSDILLTTDRLEVVQKMRVLAKKGRKIVNQNLFWAFFYNCIGIALAASGTLTPLFAAVAMVASSLMVLGNARRIGR